MQKLQLKKCAGFNFYKFFCSHAAKISPTKRKFHKLKCHKKFTVISLMKTLLVNQVLIGVLCIQTQASQEAHLLRAHTVPVHIFTALPFEQKNLTSTVKFKFMNKFTLSINMCVGPELTCFVFFFFFSCPSFLLARLRTATLRHDDEGQVSTLHYINNKCGTVSAVCTISESLYHKNAVSRFTVGF